MKKYIFLFFSIFCFLSANAQQSIGLNFMDVWQQNLTNPAHFGKNKINIGIGSIYSNTVVEGLTLNDVIRTEGDQSILDIDTAISNMNDQNSIDQYLSIETLNIGINLGKIGLSLSHALKFDAVYNYPKAFLQTVFQGNAQFIGQTVEIGSSINLNTYNELALGLAYQAEKFSIGARIKYLSGVGGAMTNPERNSASLFTDADIYQLTLSADYELQSAGFLDYNEVNDLEFQFAPSGESLILGGKNSGLAFDLGAEVNLGKLHFSASVLDIGGIEYNDNAKSYSTKGSFIYEGIDISQALSGEDIDFQSSLDTLQRIFEVTETEGAFTVNLAPQTYLSAKYDVSDKLTVGALYYGRFSDNNSKTVIALSGQMMLGKIATAGLTYSIIDDKFTNIGLNGAVKLGPVQVFALTDNLIGVVTQEGGEVVNFRVGLNLVLGKEK
ncbi:MAG: hypothetical protein ACI85O_003498 [Saprospiraceae bacterium]|jgi:hypothetical protein